LLVVFHGGGGDSEGAFEITCPAGADDDPACLDEQALARGYIVVAPNGTGLRPLRNSRTWNAGGGNGDFYCSAGAACKAGVDDLAYFDDLLAEVGRIADYDRDRVYTTGLSNGSSMSHRLACERSSVVAAVAPVSGPNQHAESGGTCTGGVPVLHIHGTEDPCAPWQDTVDASCSFLTLDGLKVGVPRTMEGWRSRNGCDDDTTEVDLPDTDPNDGTTATRVSWQNCAADVELIEIGEGGHTWPGGRQYLSVDSIGRLSSDFSASEVMLDFFDAHPTP
jgi:polyhydroxybutyrate depolymerase